MKKSTLFLSLMVGTLSFTSSQNGYASLSEEIHSQQGPLCSGYCKGECDDRRFSAILDRLHKWEESDWTGLLTTPSDGTEKPLYILTQDEWQARSALLAYPQDALFQMTQTGWVRDGDAFYAVRAPQGLSDVPAPSSFFGKLRQTLPPHHTYVLSYSLDGTELHFQGVDKIDLMSWAAGAYQRNFSTAAADKVFPSLVIAQSDSSKAFKARQLARETNMYRDLISMSLNQFTPKDGAALVQAWGDKFGAKVTIVDDQETLHDRYQSLWEVGRGSDLAPNVSILEWEPRDGVNPRLTLDLVGKGVCFDTGGHNIKHDYTSQATMYADKGGALAQLMLARLIMENNLPIKMRLINGWVVNVPGAKAQMQSDIYTYRVGTVDNGNTDAEGRLVMGAILNDLRRDVPADVTMTMATLTGAALVGAGSNAGIMHAQNSDPVRHYLKHGMRDARDPVRHFGIDPRALDILKDGTNRADLRTTGGSYGGSITADAFLRWIATGAIKGEESAPVTQFVHFDIACAGAGSTGLTPGVTSMDMFAVRGAYAGLRKYALDFSDVNATSS